MPIYGLTDSSSLEPRLPRIGRLRKGAPRQDGAVGLDLDYFRFTSNDKAVEKAFFDFYGPRPRQVDAVMYYDTYERCFSSWIELWDATGLVFRSDGRHWLVWREGDTYRVGEKPHQDSKGQRIVGRLEFVVPVLWQAGFRGTVMLETHSKNDLRNIGSVLLEAERMRQAQGLTLRGCFFTLRRVQSEISVPGWGARKGQRSRVQKWLVELLPPQELLLPENTTAAAVAEGSILFQQDVEETSLVPAHNHNPEDTLTPQGKRLGDLSDDVLSQLIEYLSAEGLVDTYQQLFNDAYLVLASRDEKRKES